VDTQNHFYGHTAALAAYAGLSRPRHVAGLIQHGWTTIPPIPVNFGDFPDVERDGRRKLFVFTVDNQAEPKRLPAAVDDVQRKAAVGPEPHGRQH